MAGSNSNWLQGGLLAAGVIAGLAWSVTTAAAYSSRVEDKCENDYNRFCSDYAPESSQTRSCMRRHSHQLSSGCQHALLDDGEGSGEHHDKHDKHNHDKHESKSKKHRDDN